MKRCLVVLLFLCAYALAQSMIVRVYASWDDLCKISLKRDLDIAGAHGGEWYDIVADQAVFDKINSSGLNYEVVVHDLAAAKDAVRASYLSYTETNDSLQQMVANYPLIAKLDSLPIPSYQGRWIYGIKISDNPDLEEDDEPGFLIDGTHHSREWACIPTVLFFADSLLTAYGSVSQITDVVNTTEIYCFPIINVDGYVYDYPSGYSWRKNREPFHGYTGTDPNRNYAGCSPDIEGDWGAVDQGQASHHPGNTLFCGAYANSGDETRALTMYVKEHICNAYMTYHSYAEKLMWPWGWTGTPAPDATLLERVGDTMASMIARLGSGHYLSGPIYSAIYPVSGSSLDWFYSYTHWVQGISNLSYTTELGTSFYQPQGDLDYIIHENFDALLYLADFCDSITILTTGVVAPPAIYPLDTVGTDFVLSWHPVNSAENDPLYWELVELSDPTVIEDDLESGTGQWQLDGFTLSTTRAHSGTHSYFSGNVDDMNHAVRTAQPYLVEPGDSVTFWCWYDLETEYDVAVVEVSENTKLWFNLDTTRFNGTQTSWQRYAYSLEDWVGKSVYIRFRSMTDSYVLNSGMYIDDIYPVVQFSNVDTIASTISDTSYAFTSHGEGEYYYYVKGYNTAWGWGDYSCLEQVLVLAGAPPESPYIYCTKSGSDVTIAWSPVTTDTLGSLTVISHYAVYRDTSPSFDLTLADSIGYVVPPDTDYVDTGALDTPDPYYYCVKAVASSGAESRKSNVGYKFDQFFNENPATVRDD